MEVLLRILKIKNDNLYLVPSNPRQPKAATPFEKGACASQSALRATETVAPTTQSALRASEALPRRCNPQPGEHTQPLRRDLQATRYHEDAVRIVGSKVRPQICLFR
jgi:hypothetical protein